jgi:hypothetical protein
VKKYVVALIAALGLLAGLIGPTGYASASPTPQARTGCIGERSIQKKPGVASPYRVGKTINFGYAEWHNSPSCRDDMRRAWVKVYKVKSGKDPKVYSTRGDRYGKSFGKGTYRVKVRYQYRYWKASARKFGKWRNITKVKTIRIG